MKCNRNSSSDPEVDIQFTYMHKYFWFVNVFFAIIGASLILIAVIGALSISSISGFLTLKNQWFTKQEDLIQRLAIYNLTKDPKNQYMISKQLNDLEIISSGIESLIYGDVKKTLHEKQFIEVTGVDDNSVRSMKLLLWFMNISPNLEEALSVKRESDRLIHKLGVIFDRMNKASGIPRVSFKRDNATNLILENSNDLARLNIRIQDSIGNSFKWLKEKLLITILLTGGFLFTVGAFTSFILYRKIKSWKRSTEKNLEEKKLLIQEIHHRVKNNLALTAGLLDLQEDKLEVGSRAQQTISESKNRIHSMALVHELLYENGDLTTVDLQVYVKKLSDLLKEALISDDKSVDFYFEIDPIKLKPEKAVPIGLILNETITNSIEHGFATRENGRIEISITQLYRNHLCLQMKDDGIGISENKDPLKSASTLGFKLIRVLVLQLDGEIEVHASEYGGVSIRIFFPINGKQ